MIGKLSGIIDSSGPEWVVIDVGGVGYVVHCSGRTLESLPGVGEAAKLSIETVVREDMIRLYGFHEELEREWFRLLQSVQGVGARVALAILTVLNHDALASAVAGQDHAALARANGVGPKLAKRIVSELKDKGPAPSIVIGRGGAAAAPAAAPVANSPQAEAISALINLGYAEPQAARGIALAQGRLGDEAGLEDLIREGLRQLAS